MDYTPRPDSIEPTRSVIARLSGLAVGGLVTLDAAAEAMKTSHRLASARLARLAKAGWLVRAKPGLYLVRPIDAPPDAATTVEDPWVLAHVVFAPSYIGGWSAAEHWSLTEQLFRSTFVVTAAPRRKKEERWLSADFHVVRVRPQRLVGTVLIWRGRDRLAISDRERTLADAFREPGWVGGMRHLAEIFANYRDSSFASPEKLLTRMAVVGNGAAYKRMGYLVEALWPAATLLVTAALRKRSKGVIRLDPAIRVRGQMNKRWGLWINASTSGSSEA
ncbi:MAG: type IV toxin-antitoxin system AbiEi family antitoxin domain-containing protein [Deltaproteobacteria bacterium]